MNIVQLIYISILMIWPTSPARQCIIARREHIEANIQASIVKYPEMPPEMIASVGFMETHLGCARGEGGNWGAPISKTRRHIAGTPIQAADALWRSYEVCGNWEAAARRFRTGLCNPTNKLIKEIGYRYGANVLSSAQRLTTNVTKIRLAEQLVCLPRSPNEENRTKALYSL